MRFTLAITAVMLLAASTLHAADPKAEDVLDGLNNPCGITVQPKTGHIFVAESGAGKVIRIVDGKAEDVITDFPLDSYGKGPKYAIGPLGLQFLDEKTLVVGGGGLADGEELLRVFQVPDAGKEAIKADAGKPTFKLAGSDELKGEGNFYALAANESGVFVTCNGDDTKGWVSKAEIKDGKLVKYERFLATKEAVEVDAPVAVTFNPRGHLVIGQMGEITVPNDSLLTFYDPASGKMLLNLETNLHDITALAYGVTPRPKKRQLYALDFAWADTKQGGLFKLVKKMEGDKQGMEARKILPLDKPTAMTFDKDGNLYITIIGSSKEGEEKKGGKVIKVTGDL